MKSEKSCEICARRECFLYRNCVPEWHDELSRNKTCIRFDKNKQVIVEGTPVAGAYFIEKGKVKVFKETTYRGQIVRLAKDGDILGHRGIEEGSKYHVSATTLEESLICFVEKEFLMKLMKNNAMLSMEMMHYYAGELRKSETQLRNMAIMTVRERVADALLMVRKAFSDEDESSLGIDFSRHDIAEIAGTYADQVSRYISEFKSDKIIEVSGKKIKFLQPEKLAELVEKYDS